MSSFSLPCIKNKLCTGSHVRLLKIHDLCLIVILINLFIPQGVCYASGTGKAMQKRKFRRIFILWRITNKKDLNCLDWNDKKGTKIVKPHLFFSYKKLHVKFCRDIYFTGTDIHICIIALSTPGAQKDWS